MIPDSENTPPDDAIEHVVRMKADAMKKIAPYIHNAIETGEWGICYEQIRFRESLCYSYLEHRGFLGLRAFVHEQYSVSIAMVIAGILYVKAGGKLSLDMTDRELMSALPMAAKFSLLMHRSKCMARRRSAESAYLN